jgi:GH25 family lysozyme M1 (1,4-beta-N-acetylmuramidase)
MRWGVWVVALTACETGPVAVPASASASASASATSLAVPSQTAAAMPSVPARASAAASSSVCRDLTAGRGVQDAGPQGAPLPPSPAPGLRGAHVSTRAPWQSLRAEGVRFAFVYASLGRTPAQDFRANWQMTKACGLPRGAYHFLSPKHDPALQARVFLDQLAGDHGELPPVIDAERPPGCSSACCERDCATWERLVATWLEAVRSATGRKPMIYTVRDWWKQCLCNTSRFAHEPLWLARYPDLKALERPGFGGWQKWLFFHHTGNVRFRGGVIDLDLFRGDAAALEQLAAGGR